MSRNVPKVITALNAVTATTTSSKFYVGGAKAIAFQFRRANHSSGSTAFSVKISMDAAETVTPVMTACNMLITNLTNTNGQTLTRVASVTISSDADAYAFLDPMVAQSIGWVEITATETTDGSHSAFISVTY